MYYMLTLFQRTKTERNMLIVSWDVSCISVIGPTTAVFGKSVDSCSIHHQGYTKSCNPHLTIKIVSAASLRFFLRAGTNMLHSFSYTKLTMLCPLSTTKLPVSPPFSICTKKFCCRSVLRTLTRSYIYKPMEYICVVQTIYCMTLPLPIWNID